MVDTLIVYPNSLIDSDGLETLIPNNKSVNKQGFLANFEYNKTTQDSLVLAGDTIIWIIGDSFIEGVTSSDNDSLTIINLLRRDKRLRRYSIWGFGKAGTDPKNYELIVKKFLCHDHLQPNRVIVAFCGDNDEMDFERIPSPFIPIQYSTNAGMLYSNPPFVDPVTEIGNFILPTPDSAYRYYLNFGKPTDKKSLWWELCSHSSLFTKLYGDKILNKIVQQREKNRISNKASLISLSKIDSICNSNQIPFQIVYVPKMSKPFPLSSRDDSIRLHEIFGSLFPIVCFPNNFSSKDFITKKKGLGHFNDVGNKKMADFLYLKISNTNR
jgi:hypothetical protein